MGAALTFLERYHQEGNNFLDHILVVAGDETWGSRIIPESKRQSLEWHCPHSPSKPIKFKHNPRKIFWDWKGVLVVEFRPKGQTIIAVSYCITLKQLQHAIQNRR
jgi:hypothetical protein